MSLGRVLIVDDDAAFRFAIAKALRRLDYEVREAASGANALIELHSPHPPDVALLDLRMDGIDGLEVLRRRGNTPTKMVVLTGHGSVQAAVDAMRLGAFTFLEKPVDAEVLAPLLEQAVGESRRSTGKGGELALPPLLGSSLAVEDVRRFIARVGPTDETVAIYGETGTGKEVVARHLHQSSHRAQGPFVALNAACVPRELFESELFGHRKGAFTGATSDRMGLFRDAASGTLFIDEVAELPLESQAKLLRALETKSIRPVGETREIPTDARIVVATNRDLWRESQEGRFREDLYFRLQVFPVMLTPLRQRPQDILPLAQDLLSRLGGSPKELTSEAQALLTTYEWPGNVRELFNVLRRAALFAERDVMNGDLLRRMIAASVFGYGSTPETQGRTSSPRIVEARSSLNSLADVERAHIEQVLQAMQGNITRAASALGIDRRTLQRKLKQYGISSEE